MNKQERKELAALVVSFNKLWVAMDKQIERFKPYCANAEWLHSYDLAVMKLHEIVCDLSALTEGDK